MARLLMVDHEKCTGCRTCEIVCSMGHVGAINPSRSRIIAIKDMTEGKGIPIVCTQCQSAPCEAICPVNAISRSDIGTVAIDYDRCIGCRICVAVCPFGAIAFDTIGGIVTKCDLCDGDPLCVRFCVYGALEYAEAADATMMKRRRAADKLSAATAKVPD